MLDAILANIRDAGFNQGREHRGLLVLGHRDQPHAVGMAARTCTGGRDLFTHRGYRRMDLSRGDDSYGHVPSFKDCFRVPAGDVVFGMAGHVLVTFWLLAAAVLGLGAEELPADSEPIPGTNANTGVTLELLGQGLIPTARVLITNGNAVRLRLPRAWTYEVITKPALTDRVLKASLPTAGNERHLTFDESAVLPEQRVCLTLSERIVFGRSGLGELFIAPRRTWGHDHLVDLRPGHFKPGLVFIRLCLGNSPGAAKSAWQRLLIPDVPDVPLLRFTSDSRKLLGEVPFKRAAQEAGLTFVAVASSGAHPWTRILTLDAQDPLAGLLPRLLLDGRSQPVFEDGVRCLFAVRGVSLTGEVAADASVVAIHPCD